MPELKYTISGDNSGLVNATNKAIANIENLTSSVNEANLSLQFTNGIAALDKLGQKLLVAQGNASLFGDSIVLQTQQLSAYQGALNALLANGFDPMDADVQKLKEHIDQLNASLAQVKNVPRTFINDPSTAPSAENLQTNNTGPVGEPSILVTALNQQLREGTITAREYAQALESANSAANTLGNTSQATSEAIIQEDGYIQGLKQALIQLNETRLLAPAEDLALLNSEIQQTEIALQQAGNIGKVGFDQLGNAIRGVSITNVNGQLLALNNNLFGGRQIAKDFTRALADGGTSISAFARNIGLLAVDFLYYAQNAQFAAAATGVASTEIVAAEGAATGATVGLGGLGAAFSSLLTPVNGIILGIALAAGGLVYLVKNNKTATEAALAHAKALKQQKEALNDYISTLDAELQVEAKAAEATETETTKLNVLYEALQLQISAGKDYTTQLNDLQDAFPQFFAQIDKATAKTNDLAEAYKNASEAVKALGLVTAASQLAGQSNIDQVKNQVGADSLLPQLLKAKTELDAATKEFNKNGAQFTQTFTGPGQGGASVAATGLNALKTSYNNILDQIGKYNTAVAEARTKTQQFYDIAAKNQNIVDTGKNSGLIASLQAQLTNLQKIEPFITDRLKLEENINEQKRIQAELDVLKQKNVTSLLNSKKEELTIQQQIAAVLAQSDASATKSGLTGYALQVAEITSKYEAFGVALDKINAKIAYRANLFNATNGKRGISSGEATVDKTALNSARGILTDNESKQLSDAKIKDAQVTADAITKINNDFGIKQDAGFTEQLFRTKKLYDSIVTAAQESALSREQIEKNYQTAVAKANGNEGALAAAKLNYEAQIQQAQDATDKISVAKADLLPAIQAIDEKYIEQEQQTYDKIISIADKAFEILDDGEASRTDKINLEYQKRLAASNKYFDKLREEARSTNTPTDSINAVQVQVNTLLDAAHFKQVSEEISKNFASAMQSAVNGFVTDFYKDITSLGATRQSIDAKYDLQIQAATSQSAKDQINAIRQLEKETTTSFGAIFSNLVSKFSSTFNESILNSFTKQLTENLGKTLLNPTGKQLTISPEEKAAEQTAITLKNAGTNLADQIRKAGFDFYNATKGGATGNLLSGASGGSSLIPGLTANASSGLAGQQIGNALSKSLTTAATTSAGTTVNAAEEASKITTTSASNFSSKLAGAASALSLAGGLISGVTKPTSSVGQGVGGLLKGAGEGALIGSAIPVIGPLAGVIIGGLIGGISGLLGASKARKELQQQQLEQAKQQTALLKASLAYTSSIIGRETSNGIVTGISVGATGQLTATVSGKDLQFVLDRNSNGR